ncbi:hypothetical protein FT663_02753 [Candidozyma haemuli var. vulneris]|uniref:dolichol kinase n=1 Tax=Candidozyma haemuli TaxID=45357 RepID=A0A2V1AT24_9ASCO|nr:hypothetical protein CXQ85_000322 [[Candida] haemuloni]KAF3989389.1 hypothetical protein FT662_02842 [[Candida] haemuloni var. vulneris]KAF3991346.1 hypothetical protein FT663_02753 [[Candida] haemuloni var. vulneris]PVH21347.1 hypothetical protein CXQ85_000322 [[Candida] haemuloni]
MARRKEATKAEKSASARTTASVFQNYDANAEETSAKQVEEPQPQRMVESDDPSQYNFPWNVIYEFQDFLNIYMDFCKAAQIMTVLYIGQIFYVYLTNIKDNKTITSVAFNLVGAVLAMWLNHRSMLKKHKDEPDRFRAPTLPDFNTLYAFVIPILSYVLLGDTNAPFFQVNLALNNFAIRELHIVAKVLSSFVFYYIYNDSSTLEVTYFLRVVLSYFSFEYILDGWNELGEDEETSVKLATMLPSEIHMISVLLVNLLYNFDTETQPFPLVLFRELLISLIVASFAAYQLYWVYLRMAQNFLRKTVAVLIAVVFAGVFYFAMNYLFTKELSEKDPVLWLIDYVLESESRLHLIIYWLTCLLGGIPVVFWLAYNNKINLNLRRKVWHFMLVICLAYPAFVHQPEFTAIALLGSLVVFIVIEMIRSTRITFLGEFLYTELRFFQDDKDLKGPLNLSYIFLLAGVAAPLAYGYALGDVVNLRSYMGLVTLGLGDSLASIVGKRFGRIKWKGAERTLEGTITFMVVTFASFVVIDFYLLPEENRVKNWENTFIIAMVAGILEGSATLNDNILIPCVVTLTYDLLNRTF